jgi:multidrug efflux system outer membrane protein
MNFIHLQRTAATRQRGGRPPAVRRRCACVSALCLAGCAAVGPDYGAPPPSPIPERWNGAHDPGATGTLKQLAGWWAQFGDPVLDGLIADALRANTDLASARGKLREARARRDLARAGLAPSVTASGNARRIDGSRETGSGASRDLFSAAFDASWEPDVFGARRRGVEAAEADLQASAETLRDTRVTLLAEVARNYVELRAGEQRLAIAIAGLDAQSETFDLTRWRREAGLVSELDEALALTELERTRAALPGLQTAVAEARHRLAILLGRAPGELDASGCPPARAYRSQPRPWRRVFRPTRCGNAPTCALRSAGLPPRPLASARRKRRVTRRSVSPARSVWKR